jgi:hypothetical protein
MTKDETTATQGAINVLNGLLDICAEQNATAVPASELKKVRNALETRLRNEGT